MNYRHVYHAGNFADVVKHAVLALVIERLKHKDAAFRVIDTHAGLGSYDLAAEAAAKTQEWRSGIGRLVGPDAEPLPRHAAAILAPYLDVVRALNPAGALSCYPGSPRLARALLRPQDRLVVNELHPEDARTLRESFVRDAQVTVMELNGWIALKALLPPRERRGVVLIDPPFEARGELGRLVLALEAAVRRFATGIYVLWYPIKDRSAVQRFKRDLQATGLPRLLVLEVMVRNGHDRLLMNGAGLAIVNPPYQLDRTLGSLMPFLAERLALAAGGGWTLEWLNDEHG